MPVKVEDDVTLMIFFSSSHLSFDRSLFHFSWKNLHRIFVLLRPEIVVSLVSKLLFETFAKKFFSSEYETSDE